MGKTPNGVVFDWHDSLRCFIAFRVIVFQAGLGNRLCNDPKEGISLAIRSSF
jgi:hypothetical protein